MGLMTKMRDNTGVVLWILVIAFGVIFMLQDTNVFDVIGATGNIIAKVNGQDVSLDEYNNYVNNQVEAYRQRTGESIPPQILDSERERVFNELVDDRLREQEMSRIGIVVTDDEVRQMVLGDNPHQIIRTFFGDGQGNVDRAVLRNFIENPDAREDLIRIEDYLRTERRREKLDRLIDASVRVSDQDVLSEYISQKKRINVQYVALPYALVPDSAITVSERDIRKYYDEHLSDYERKRAYSLVYVRSSKTPTSSDSAAVTEELVRLKPRFEAAENDSLFLAQNFSETPLSDAFFGRGDLDDAIAEAVFQSPRKGDVLGPVAAGGSMHLVKILDVKSADDPSVRARHILIRAAEDDNVQRTAARELARSVMERIRAGEDFAAVARAISDDTQSARDGGDVGWFSKGRMVKPFEDAAFAARVGRLIGPVETQFGYHVIEVTGRSTDEVQIADFALKLAPSVATLTRVEENLDDLKFFAEEEGGFRAEAERRGLTVQTVQVEADQQFIPGIGNSRALLNFLATASVSSISPVVELNDDFMVAEVTDIQEAGYRPLADVRAEIEPRVRLEKKRDVQLAKMTNANASGLSELASVLSTTVRTANGLTMSEPVVPGLGREPKFVGTTFGLQQGQVSRPVAGQNNAFVIDVLSIAEPPEITDAEKERIRNQLLTQRRSQVRSQWLTSIRSKADVTDNRRFFLQ
ncbi:MAG: peptidylprolyl isomerase [Rhodothermales bacterium]|nr:peptidylprolyl isomerase [Rhodothermales bacterium]